MRTPDSDRRIDVATSVGLVVMWSSGFIGAELGTRTAPADTLLAWPAERPVRTGGSA